MYLDDSGNFKKLRSLTFFGLQGQHVSQEDIDAVEYQQEKIEDINFVFYGRDIIGSKAKLADYLLNKQEGERSMTCVDLTSMKARFAPGVSEPNIC